MNMIVATNHSLVRRMDKWFINYMNHHQSASWPVKCVNKHFSPPLYLSLHCRHENFPFQKWRDSAIYLNSEFQVHLTSSFLSRCNNRGTYQNKWFSRNSWGLKKPFLLFLMDNMKLDASRWHFQAKWSKNMWLFYIASHILKVPLLKSYLIQLPVLLFLDVLHQQRTSFTIIRKKIFDMIFPFLMDSSQPPIPQALTVIIHKAW